MSKNNVKISNARHESLVDKNRCKMVVAHNSGDPKWKQFDCNMTYHRSVIKSQTHAGRVLTPKERKHLYASVKRSHGRVVLYLPSK